MLVGQDRTGKTSLKKSLRGQEFNHDEDSTNGIERDPSYFSLSTEIWSTGQKKLEPDSDSDFSLPHRIAQCMVADLKGEGSHQVASEIVDVQNTGKALSSKTLQTERGNSEIGKQNLEQSKHSGLLVSSGFPKLDEKKSKEELVEQEVPGTTAACVEKLLQSERKDEDKVYSILWDFGGQSVYYVTHSLFLTSKAIYLLVYDLSRNPRDRAPPIVKQGIFKQKEDRFCRKTNEDYLHFWLSSISSVIGQSKNHPLTKFIHSKKLPKVLPPVILVCTHADKCPRASELASEIYGSLSDQANPYREHLVKKFFMVDNTRSGSTDECPNVKRLRKEVLAVAKQLPQMESVIPIKWLRFEEALKSKSDNGEPYISLDEAWRVAIEECEISDDQQFRTLLNFLHDQRVLIHFDGTPELDRMVILDLPWLIDLFKRVITIKRYDPAAEDEQFEELWKKLENEGILDDELLQIVWQPLLKVETKTTTIESLVHIMEKFSLLCHWPTEDKTKQYLVPSMLMYPPDDNATKLLASTTFPPLFIRFRQPHPLYFPHGEQNAKSCAEYMYAQVPLGMFPRLVVKFLQWCTEERFRPLYKDMYQNFARFPVHSTEGYSVILLCHSSSIEIVVHRKADTKSGTSAMNIGRMVRSYLESMLREMRSEFVWLNSLEYELCVLCPICCKQGAVSCCRRHDMNRCDKEKCLHYWSESDLQKEQFCTKDAFAESIRVPVEAFLPWFEFSWMVMYESFVVKGLFWFSLLRIDIRLH